MIPIEKVNRYTLLQGILGELKTRMNIEDILKKNIASILIPTIMKKMFGELYAEILELLELNGDNLSASKAD